MTNSPTPRPAAEIAVTQFRQILLWPLLLHKVVDHKKIPAAPDFFDDVTRELEKDRKWTWDDRDQPTAKLHGLPWYHAEEDYSEVVYFHSFVRDFLYGGDSTKPKDRPLRVFRRNDVTFYVVTLKSGLAYTLAVERSEFHLFESGVSVLVLELKDPQRADGKAIGLNEIMDLQNALRMAFPRRWKGDVPQECPLQIELKVRDHPSVKQDYSFSHQADFTTIVREHAELPAAAHLQFLLHPFGIYGPTRAGYCYQQIEDQRLPSMSYLAVKEPREISEWDFARLAFFDDAGESAVGSYSDQYLADWAKACAYDRFWQRDPSQPSFGDAKEIAAHNGMMRTRWLCSGYGFVVVGVDDRADKEPFYTSQIRANFQHHYFRMGLIVHFHRASILGLRDALADATRLKDEEKRRALTKVQEGMVAFRSRFWFREVSTQLQGQEIFRWWSDLLGNQELFLQVSADVDAAAVLVRTQQEEIENRTMKKLTRVAAMIGAFGLGLAFLSLVVAILSWSFFHVGDVEAQWSAAVAGNAGWKLLVVLMGSVLVSGPIGVVLWKILNKQLNLSDEVR